MQLTQLRLENFKIFAKASINFRPLTLLTGTNSSGKSTILNAITAVLQAQPTHIFPFEFIPNGKNCLLGSFRDIVSGSNTRKNFSIGLSLRTHTEVEIDGAFRYSPNVNQILPYELSYTDPRNSLVLKWFGSERGYRSLIKSKTWERVSADENFSNLKRSLLSIAKSGSKKQGSAASKLSSKNNFKKLEEQFFGRQVDKWIDLKSRFPKELFREIDAQPAGGYICQVLSSTSNGLASHLSYIGPVRVYPSRFYQSGGMTQGVEPSGKNSAILLYEWKRSSPRKYAEAIKLLQLLELASKFDTKTGLDEILKLDVQPFQHSEKVNIADVGFGISQVLPVITADIGLPTQGTLLVNQPEVHLHPSSQALLGNYFSTRLGNRRYIIETHSEYLINRLRLLVVEGKLESKDVSILFLEPPVGRMKNPKIHYIEIGKDGSLVNAPKSFFSTYYLDTFNIAMGGFSDDK